jgi:hypothetical protein
MRCGTRRVRAVSILAGAKIRFCRLYEVRSEPEPERSPMPKLRQRQLDLEELTGSCSPMDSSPVRIRSSFGSVVYWHSESLIDDEMLDREPSRFEFQSDRLERREDRCPGGVRFSRIGVSQSSQICRVQFEHDIERSGETGGIDHGPARQP